MNRKILLQLSAAASALLLAMEGASAQVSVDHNNVDNTRNVVFSINTDSGQTLDTEGNGYFAILVDKRYDYSGTHSSSPPGGAEFWITDTQIRLKENTSVGGTLGVSGASTLSSTLAVTGASTLSSTLDVTGTSTLGQSTISGSTGGASIIKGGTKSGILTLQDGDTAATPATPTTPATPAGTSITISGSGGGTAATVFQTTTNATTTSVTTSVGTNANYPGGSTATMQAGPSNVVTVNSGNVGSVPGVSINGVVGTGSTSKTGVLITGSGQNSLPYTTADRTNGVVPTWADVAIQSKSYGLGDPTLGSAILVTDYGVQIVSPQPIAGQQITNNSGSNNSTGQVVNNNGLNTSSGSVTNNNGNNTGSGIATNNIGLNTSSGSVTNNNGNNSGSGVATNNIGNNNANGIAINNTGNNNGSGAAVNNTGNNSGSGSATNNFGMNTSTTGGFVANNFGGTSGNGNVNNVFGQNNGTGVAFNAFGTGSGVTNNFIGNNNPASTVQLDGGPSRMTLNGNGATFSNSSTGGPIQVHGVADGTAPSDAANVSQVFSGVAASMATAPSVANLKPGEAGFGLGFGHYAGYSALGLNLTYYARNEAQLNLGVARGIQSGAQTAFRASIGFKF